MRELTYLVATSIDGLIAAPDGDITPLLVKGAHVEALIERYPETFPDAAPSSPTAGTLAGCVAALPFNYATSSQPPGHLAESPIAVARSSSPSAWFRQHPLG